MGDGSVFDVARVRRALSGLLAPDERVEAVAVDDATGAYWAITTTDFVVLKDDRPIFRGRLNELAGSTRTGPGGITLVVHHRPHGHVTVGTFRRPNKVTARLADRLSPLPDAADPPTPDD